MTVAETLTEHGIRLKNPVAGRHYTTCPQCSAKRTKKNDKCLGITIDARGVRWGCNHCGWSGPEKGSGTGRDLDEITYDYRDVDGNLLFQKVRGYKNGEKFFWLRRPNNLGGWVNNVKGVNTKIVYRADQVKKAIGEGRTIAVVEGEKDADRVSAVAGIVATCNAHGASEAGKQPKWTKAHSQQLAGADIVVLGDNDAAGYAHADATCRLSIGVATRVRRLDLAPHWPDMPKGADVSDWLALGHTREELDALIAAAPDYGPTEAPQSAAATPAPTAPTANANSTDD